MRLPLPCIAFVLGCGSTKAEPPRRATEIAVSAPSLSASAAPPEQELRMYFAGEVYSLRDLVQTAGGVELRTGSYTGGGMLGRTRFMPLENLEPRLELETAPIDHADTTSFGRVQLAGSRPKLILHEISGFRGPPGESYSQLTDAGLFEPLSTDYAPGLGAGMFDVSGGVIEARQYVPTDEQEPDEVAFLPGFRVVHGNPLVPLLLSEQEDRLTRMGFWQEAAWAFPAGGAIAVGRTSEAKVATVVFPAAAPAQIYESSLAFPGGASAQFLGGTSPADTRLVIGETVFAWRADQWESLGALPKDQPPDLWFGRPLVHQVEDKCFLRTAAGGVWQLVPQGEQKSTDSCVLLSDGTVLANEGERVYASRPVTKPFAVTEKDLARARKRRVLHGGYHDATGRPFDPFSTLGGEGSSDRTCSQHYVMLDLAQSPKAVEKGRLVAFAAKAPEMRGARLVASREGSVELIGVVVADESSAKTIAAAAQKALAVRAPVFCASPDVIGDLTPKAP